MFPPALLARADALVAGCRARSIVMTTAESCTGGLVAALVTEIAGSSAVFDRGVVTYSNEAKRSLLGVPEDVLRRHGAVSDACARAMAEGALQRSDATVAVSITGVAGPGGGSDDKPVGLVFFARASRGGRITLVERRFGPLGRTAVRLAAVSEAVRLFEDAVTGSD